MGQVFGQRSSCWPSAHTLLCGTGGNFSDVIFVLHRQPWPASTVGIAGAPARAMAVRHRLGGQHLAWRIRCFKRRPGVGWRVCVGLLLNSLHSWPRLPRLVSARACINCADWTPLSVAQLSCCTTRLAGWPAPRDHHSTGYEPEFSARACSVRALAAACVAHQAVVRATQHGVPLNKACYSTLQGSGPIPPALACARFAEAWGRQAEAEARTTCVCSDAAARGRVLHLCVCSCACAGALAQQSLRMRVHLYDSLPSVAAFFFTIISSRVVACRCFSLQHFPLLRQRWPPAGAVFQ